MKRALTPSCGARGTRPQDDLGAMGQAYIEYAVKHPLQYRLMFNTPLPDPEHHPDMMRNAQDAFSLLQSGIEALHMSRQNPDTRRRTDFDALFVWFTLHGLCSVMQSRVVKTLALPKHVLDAMDVETFDRIGWVLEAEATGTNGS